MMHISASTAIVAAVGSSSSSSSSRSSVFSHVFAADVTPSSTSFFCCPTSSFIPRRPSFSASKVSVSGDGFKTQGTIDRVNGENVEDDRQSRRYADWKAAKDYLESGVIYQGRVDGANAGGLRVRFFSILGFLPFRQLSPSHSCKEPYKSIQEIAKGLIGSVIYVKVICAEEENKKLILSEKEAMWSEFSRFVKVGDVSQARVGSVEDYGAFVHLRCPDGRYHLTGLLHVSEVSWDVVQDVGDILKVGDDVKVKVTNVDRVNMRIALSMKQLEEDPLLETLEKVIPQDGSISLDGSIDYVIEPLPGLETILAELLKEDGIRDVKITRQGFEKRVVSQDLQLWLSNAPSDGTKFTLLARAGRQVQEIQLITSLDQDGIKSALQRVLERIP